MGTTLCQVFHFWQKGQIDTQKIQKLYNKFINKIQPTNNCLVGAVYKVKFMIYKWNWKQKEIQDYLMIHVF